MFSYKRILFTSIALAATLCLPISAENILNIEGGEATSVGIYVKELSSGKVLVDHNSELALTPASVTKALTSATALSVLGSDFHFTTTVGYSGTRSGSHCNGNLVINASGDPTIGSKQFKSTASFTDSIITSLKQLGITSFSGTVVIRESMLDQGPVPQWEIEDVAWPYGAGLHAFNYAGNTVFVNPNTGKSRPESNLRVTLLPASEKDGNDMLRGVNSQNLTVWGTPNSRKNRNWSLETTIPDPAEVYAELLISRLKNAGISISTKKAKVNNDNIELVYRHISPCLDDICRDLMKRSDNLFAEGMLRAIAPGKSRSDCIKAEKEFWSDKRLASRFIMLSDGSGLTRSNRISPRFLGDMLEWMIKSPAASSYINYFPVAGVDGTLKSLLDKTRLKGRLAMKTGSMASVQAYAGYKLDATGHPTHIVVIMVNGFFCGRASLRKQIESFLLKTFP